MEFRSRTWRSTNRNLDGSGIKALTHSSGYDAEGSFSNDGKHIVFTSTRNGNPNLYIMDADGSNVRQLTHQPAYNGGPFFSPDDKWVIFRSDRKKKDMLQLYAISADGKHEVELTNNLDTVNWAPYFHPSGKYIVYTMADYVAWSARCDVRPLHDGDRARRHALQRGRGDAGHRQEGD